MKKSAIFQSTLIIDSDDGSTKQSITFEENSRDFLIPYNS